MAGQAAPGPGERWGYGRWTNVIARHWSDTDFGDQRVFPWVLEADRRLRDGDALGVDRLFMEYSWHELGRLGAGHYFDFEAVAIYVLRWDLIDRWTHYDAESARKRIVALADASLGDYQEMYA